MFVGPIYMLAEYFYYKWLQENQRQIYEGLQDPLLKVKMLDPEETIKHKMSWTATYILFYITATYMNQLDVC